MYSLTYALSTLPSEEFIALEAFGEIDADPPAEEGPADHSAADERWLIEHRDDDHGDDDHGVNLLPIDVSTLPPSALYGAADGPMGSAFGHHA